MSDNNNVFRTMDLALAAYLKTAGYPINHIEVRTHGRKATICFPYTDELIDDKDDYFNGQATVDPQAFFNNIRNLKSRINNEINEN